MSKLLTMSPIGAPDALARERALDITRSWIVEAPAGSGKTGLLVQRYLRLLTDPNVSEPEQVLAITFTKAATEEIRDRVVRELTRASEGGEVKTEYDRATRTMATAVLIRDTELGWGMLDDPGRLRVRTIDAVCAEIARSLPVLCDGNGSLTPVEDPDTLYTEAARRTWMCLGGADTVLSEALRSLLLHRDGDLNSCITLVAEMLAHRQEWGSLIPVREQDLSEEESDAFALHQLDKTLEHVICETLRRLVRAFPEQVLRRLTTLANTLGERSGYNGRPSPIAICRELRSAPAAAVEHLVHWRALSHLLITPSTQTWRKRISPSDLRFEFRDQDKVSLEEIALDIQQYPELLELLNDASALPLPQFPIEFWPLTRSLFAILRHAVTELQTVFLETSQCDFVEPALLARYALTQQGGADDLRTALGTELRHLLVDEMQDTSGHQYDLVERLTRGWQQERKTVFLVGDPKQSIYLFRQARVERFNETMRTGMLGILPVGPLQLTANFRSQAGLIEAFNQDFSRIFPRTTKRAEDVIYVPAAATRPVSQGLTAVTGVAWHLSVATGDRTEVRRASQEQTHQNARAIREVLEAWRARPLPGGRTAPWRIAILVHSRASLGPVLAELRREPSIPISALKIDTLNERPEILDLLSLTRALLHPADRTAWLAVLHAPWCGLGLGDLHTLTGNDNPTHLGRTMMSLVSAHGGDLSPDGVIRLERVWPALQAGANSAGNLRLPERVERTWRSLNGDSYLSETAQRNAATFFKLLQSMNDEKGEIGDTDLSRRLRRLYATPEAQAGAVDLVTIHGAKGLEWDVVLVPELERRSAGNTSRLFEWEEVFTSGVVLAPIKGKGEEALELTKWLHRVRSKREASEKKRLFYVACTRAREELHLFGIASRSQKGSVHADVSSLLHTSWSAAELHLTEMQDVDTSHTSRAGVLPTLAATEAPELDVHRPMLERLPLAAMPLLRANAAVQNPPTSHTESNGLLALRPHGSFAARQLGTAVHLFLEEAANRLATGTGISELALEIPSWETRVHALLRGSGLAPQVIERSAQTILRALRTTLLDPVGGWMLGAQVEAHSELALAAKEQQITKYRVDRVFRAGAGPLEAGSDYLWIIDYKTTVFVGESQNQTALQSFFDKERSRHQHQLQTYGRLLSANAVRLGLWFPLMGKLCWWSGDDATQFGEQQRNHPQLLLFQQAETQ